MRKIIVTGGTGQTGSYMIEYLLQNTEDFIIIALRRTSQAILSNLKNVINSPRIKLVTMDLNDVHSIDSLIKTEMPDYFINLAAQTFVADSWESPALFMQTNATSLIHILEAIRKYNPSCRVYSAGTSEQWGDVKYSPQDEKHPMSPRSMYGVSKCAASHICKVYRESYGLYVVHGILLNHESERRQEYFVTRKITKAVAKISKAIQNDEDFAVLELGNLDSKRDWSYAPDFVDGIWRMLNQEKHRKELLNVNENELSKHLKEYVLASGECHSIREFVELAFSIALPNYEFKWINDNFVTINDSKLLVRVNPAFYRPADVLTLCGNSSLAREELGWCPKVKFQELVKIMVDYDLNQ